MPNQVHVLLLPKTSLPVILRWWKGSTARPANLILGRTGEAFWQDESFDHCVRDEAELDRLVRYVEYNPISAGLAANPRAWRWSSARLGRGRDGRYRPPPAQIRASAPNAHGSYLGWVDAKRTSGYG